MDKLLQINDISLEYKDFRLDNVSFSCGSGDIIGLIGINGAGKSTTINAILNIVEPDSGLVTWKGTEISKNNISKFREQVGFVGENICYYPTIPLKKILSFMSRIYSNWDNERASKLIKLFNLNTTKRMRELSTGMRVKFNLLIAMSHNADIYILDEPTSGLDPLIRKEVLEILYNEAKKEGKAVIISSHITSDLEKIADRAVYIVDGRIAEDIVLSEVSNKYAKLIPESANGTISLESVLYYLQGECTTIKREQ